MGSKSQGSGSSTPTLPGWLTSMLQGEARGFQGMPGLFQLFQNTPELGISPGQQNDIDMMQYFAGRGGMNPLMRESAKDLRQFAGSPGTPSAATNAEIKEFKDIESPLLMNSAASMGLGNSGAALESISQGQERALVPFLQQDQQNSFNAAEALGNLGQEAYGNRRNALMDAFQASNTANQNKYNMQEQQWGLGTQSNEQLMQLFGSLFGQKQHQSSSGFDWSSLF